MKSLGTILEIYLSVAVLLVASGCGGTRGHKFTETTAYIGGDGETNRVVTVDFDSHLKLWNSKLDLEKVKLHEGFGKDGWSYDVGFDSANARPDNAIVDRLAQVGLGYLGRDLPVYGGGETKERLSRLEEKLNALGKLLEAEEPEPESEEAQ